MPRMKPSDTKTTDLRPAKRLDAAHNVLETPERSCGGQCAALVVRRLRRMRRLRELAGPRRAASTSPGDPFGAAAKAATPSDCAASTSPVDGRVQQPAVGGELLEAPAPPAVRMMATRSPGCSCSVDIVVQHLVRTSTVLWNDRPRSSTTMARTRRVRARRLPTARPTRDAQPRQRRAPGRRRAGAAGPRPGATGVGRRPPAAPSAGCRARPPRSRRRQVGDLAAFPSTTTASTVASRTPARNVGHSSR